MSTLYNKLEQDDEILKDLDNKLRTSSRRTYLEDDNFAEPGEKSSSLPSLASFGGDDWKVITKKSDHEPLYDGYNIDKDRDKGLY